MSSTRARLSNPKLRFSQEVSETYDKMRIIAAREGLMLKDVMDSAFHMAIERYQAKHGPISMEMARISDKEELFK